MNLETAFETIGLIASLLAFALFLFPKAKGPLLNRRSKAALLVLLLAASAKYAINALEWSQLLAFDLDPVEDYLDNLWPIAWFFLLFNFLVAHGEKAISDSEERYRALVENAKDGYCLVQIPSGHILFYNRKFQELCGLSEKESPNATLWRVVHSGDHPWLKERITRWGHGNGKAYGTRICKAVRKDGSSFRAELALSELTFQQTKALQCVMKDITEQQRLQQQIQRAERLEAIGTLAGGIAHDFNNLLMAIEGNASLSLLEENLSKSVRRRLDNIEQYVQDGAQLTRQLLGFARGGKYEVKVTDVNRLLLKTSQLFGRTKKEIAIHVDCQTGIWAVEVDRGQIEQVLLNLFVNAWQAMPNGGHLYLRTENVSPSPRILLPHGLNEGRFVKISVEDTGVGIESDILDRIFDPFFTTKELSRGTGLGLASAYGIIKNHYGFIDVSSEKEVGTTFEIFLPASEKPVPKKAHGKNTLKHGTETVLLVDDEEMIIDVGRDLLEALGYQVLTASGGPEAIQIYREKQDYIELVILDMIMPEMGGSETFDRLKEINPGLKVLLSSGYSMNGEAKDIMKKGCDGFIQKPFVLEALSKKIREILDT
jgi:two-component system cell cycle sensor histidine kinase/response regulator CckA